MASVRVRRGRCDTAFTPPRRTPPSPTLPAVTSPTAFVARRTERTGRSARRTNYSTPHTLVSSFCDRLPVRVLGRLDVCFRVQATNLNQVPTFRPRGGPLSETGGVCFADRLTGSQPKIRLDSRACSQRSRDSQSREFCHHDHTRRVDSLPPVLPKTPTPFDWQTKQDQFTYSRDRERVREGGGWLDLDL